MDDKKVRLAVSILLNIVVVIVGAGVIFIAGSKAYTFGHNIFDEQAVDTKENARETEITVPENVSAKELARIIYEKGLAEDETIFYFQIKLSEYDNQFVAGTYTLNTAMKPSEIMKKLSEKGK